MSSSSRKRPHCIEKGGGALEDGDDSIYRWNIDSIEGIYLSDTYNTIAMLINKFRVTTFKEGLPRLASFTLSLLLF